LKSWYRTAPLVALGLLIVTGIAFADPMVATITLGRDPEPPMCVDNPGGTVTINWDIEHITTPNYVYFKIEDPTRTTILDSLTYSGSTGINIVRDWTVPSGSVDGKYWVRVEYWSFEAGNEANAEVTFYVCTGTGDICAEKRADLTDDGDCEDAGDLPQANWWIGLTTPYGDTYYKKTDVNGQACWTGLMMGDYTITEVMMAGWEPLGPTSYPVTLSGSTEWVYFCNREIPVSSEESSWGRVKGLFR
jgi:hypothetical protein